jgi:flagellin
MLRIGNRSSGLDLTVQNNLAQALNQLNQSNLRLATFKRINAASDDPAGLIASETLRTELISLEAADRNASRAAATVRTADSSLSQASDLLRSIRANVAEAAGGNLSSDQLAAKQIEIDAALDAINFIGRTTNLGGRRLLDGSSGFDASPINSTQLADLQVFNRSGEGPLQFDIEVVQSATSARRSFEVSEEGLAEATSLIVGGADGSVTLDFEAGASADQIAEAINAATEQSGVSAEVEGSTVTLSSAQVGGDAIVSAEAAVGSLEISDLQAGADVVVRVNGQETTGDGNRVALQTAEFDVAFTVAAGFEGKADPAVVSGQGLQFLFSANPVDVVRLSLPKVATSSLGGAAGSLDLLRSGRAASLTSGDFSRAAAILDEASNSVASARGRLGAFEKFTIDSSRALLSSARENASQALGSIADADLAEESARNIRAQILADASLRSVVLASRRSTSILDLFDAL